MIDRKVIIKVILFILWWVTGFSLVYSTMSHSEVKTAYGLITGWWFACYLGYVTNIKIEVAIPCYLLFVFISIISFLIGYTWFYQGAGSSLSLRLIMVIVVQGIVFISPILVNSLTRVIYQKTNK